MFVLRMVKRFMGTQAQASRVIFLYKVSATLSADGFLLYLEIHRKITTKFSEIQLADNHSLPTHKNRLLIFSNLYAKMKNFSITRQPTT